MTGVRIGRNEHLARTSTTGTGDNLDSHMEDITFGVPDDHFAGQLQTRAHT